MNNPKCIVWILQMIVTIKYVYCNFWILKTANTKNCQYQNSKYYKL